MTSTATIPQRIINRYDGHEHGALLIALGGMHGNEPAGVKAIETVFEMLAQEPSKNSNFRFKGRFLGLRGNLSALHAHCRQIEKDLNRQFTTQNIHRLKKLTRNGVKI
ncbi:MAG: murein peptide amidase A [Saprospiraceae bacterium]|nr:murein peptide amidase A [Saprospiraceae bacterium]